MLKRLDAWLRKIGFFRPAPPWELWVQSKVMPIVGPIIFFIAIAMAAGMLGGVVWIGFVDVTTRFYDACK